MSHPKLLTGFTNLSEVSLQEMKEKLLSNPVTHDHHGKMAPPKKKMPYNPILLLGCGQMKWLGR